MMRILLLSIVTLSARATSANWALADTSLAQSFDEGVYVMRRSKRDYLTTVNVPVEHDYELGPESDLFNHMFEEGFR